jgi:hypothetical protein
VLGDRYKPAENNLVRIAPTPSGVLAAANTGHAHLVQITTQGIRAAASDRGIHKTR